MTTLHNTSRARGPNGRWASGHSGNPRGSPKRPKCLTRELERILARRVNGRPIRVAVANKVIKMALEGDVSALRLLWSYVDGLPLQRVLDETPRGDGRVFEVLFRVLDHHPEAKAELDVELERIE
jgi:hypothetical protein